MACCVVTACGGDDGINEGGKQQVEDQDEDDTKATLDESYEYKLPVIFHVIYKDANDASQYIPSARLQQLLTYVNMIYSGGLFGESENVNVKFVAATYDEKGNKLDTPGVEYVKWNGTYPISPLKFMGDNSGKYVSYLWDPNEYINVMMYNFADGGDSDEGTVLGISHMPYTIVGSTALEGLETTKAKNIKVDLAELLGKRFILIRMATEDITRATDMPTATTRQHISRHSMWWLLCRMSLVTI